MKIIILCGLFMALALSGCFTGIENTGRITEKDVSRVKADKQSPEEIFFDTVHPADFQHWRPGKLFYVNDDNIRLIFNSSSLYDVGSLQLKGDTLKYDGYKFVRSIDNSEDVVISLSDSANTYYYNTGKTIDEVEEQKSEYIVPFLIDLDYVARIRDMLVGKTLYIKTSLWMDSERNNIDGLHYVPVVITNVSPGDVVYPFFVEFECNGRKAAVYMSSQISSIKNMTFDKLFSFTDLRKKFSHITDANWERITRGDVAVSMTKDECQLSLGSPRSIERVPTHGGLYERWSYDNGVYLIFENGLLTRYRK